MSRAAALFLALAGAPAEPVGRAVEEFELQPRKIAWEDLSPAYFDLARRLPARPTSGSDLAAKMSQLAALTFELEDADGRPLRTVGDLALGARAAADADAWLEAALRSSPELEAAWGRALRELLRDRTLRGPRWDPDDDDPRDGILLAGAWDLTAEGAPWSALPNRPLAQQGAVVMFADLATIKAAENDYVAYKSDPGASYEKIYPRRGSYVRGVDPAGNAFTALAIHFRCDLPLWYPDYRCDLHLLNTVDGDGRLVCDIYSTSNDFHWLAGRDLYLPLVTGGGVRAAYLVVRQYGFDLNGVPDRASNVRDALRASLGSLKLRAERSTGSRSSAAADTDPTRVPEFPVRGER